MDFPRNSSAALSCICSSHQPVSRNWDRLFGCPQVHGKAPTVLQALPANGPIPRPREPRGSRRQIVYFIGLFLYLEDLKFLYDTVDRWEEPVDDPTLILPFGPPSGGRLTVMCFTRVGVLKGMIRLFRGSNFIPWMPLMFARYAPIWCLWGNVGNIANVPGRSSW